jgi:hypothetical protein
LSVNSTTIPSEDAISISTSIVNTLPTINNLTASNDWAIQGLTLGNCNYGDSTNKLFAPAGIDVFRGYYGMNNLSAGNPLQIWAVIGCPVDYAFNGTGIAGQLQNITSYSFLPGNDSGYYSAYYSTSTKIVKGVFPTRMVNDGTFYAANSTGPPMFFNSLGSSLPSEYTIAAGDEWGQIVLLHFAVTQSNNLPTVGEFLSSPSSGGCTVNGIPVPCVTSEFSQAIIFNCASAAAASAGCTVQLTSGMGSFTITVWYPYVNQIDEPSSANCMFNVPDYTSSPYGYCFLVNSTAFALSPI